MRIAPWPVDDGNPYQRLFYGALAPYGVSIVRGLVINDDYLREHRGEIDAIHLHWPEYIWRVGVETTLGRARRIAGFRGFLRLCRELRLPVIWTAHNTLPHEGTWLDRIGLSLVRESSDLIIAHSDRTTAALRAMGARNVVMMSQGNYDGEYPAPRKRDDVLAELGFSSERPLVALIGALRPYKGVQFAVDAVSALSGRVQLVVAGYPKPGFDLDGLLAAAGRNAWLSVVAKSLSDQEFSDLIHASTAILLPYTRLTTSAVLLAGWTLGRGSITSQEPYFTDLLAEHPLAGRAVDVRSAVNFAGAIESYLGVDETVRFAEARKAADRYAWTRCVEPVVEGLQGLGLRP